MISGNKELCQVGSDDIGEQGVMLSGRGKLYKGIWSDVVR